MKFFNSSTEAMKDKRTQWARRKGGEVTCEMFTYSQDTLSALRLSICIVWIFILTRNFFFLGVNSCFTHSPSKEKKNYKSSLMQLIAVLLYY